MDVGHLRAVQRLVVCVLGPGRWERCVRGPDGWSLLRRGLVPTDVCATQPGSRESLEKFADIGVSLAQVPFPFSASFHPKYNAAVCRQALGDPVVAVSLWVPPLSSRNTLGEAKRPPAGRHRPCAVQGGWSLPPAPRFQLGLDKARTGGSPRAEGRRSPQGTESPAVE